MAEATLNTEEREIMGEIISVHKKIVGMGLQANHCELANAIHVLQSFVVMHMLQRTSPEVWSSWFVEKGHGGGES